MCPVVVPRLMLTTALLALPGALAAQQTRAPPPFRTDSILTTLGREGLGVLAWEGRRAVELMRLRSSWRGQPDPRFYHGVWFRDDGADSVVFDFEPLAAPARQASGLSLAYDEGAGPRGWVGAVDQAPLADALQVSAARLLAGLWRALAPGVAALRPPPGLRLGRAAVLRLGMEPVYFFGTDGRDAASAETRAVTLRAGWQEEVAPGWQLLAGGEGSAWRTPGLPDRVRVGATVRLMRPVPFAPPSVFAEAAWNADYRRFTVEVGPTYRLAALALRPYARLGWGDSLPFMAGLWFGGWEGFPGLHAGEGWGDRELATGLDAAQPLLGPLTLRVLGAVGRTAVGGPLVDGHGWLAGIRAGLGLATPVGLVRVDYGIATGDRHALLVHLGQWF